jgi:plastocyanin
MDTMPVAARAFAGSAMPAVARTLAGSTMSAASRAFACALACAIALLSSAGAHAAQAAPKPAAHTVVIDGTRFEPASLSVRRGDVVVWVNRDPFPHTATAAGAFDSGSIAAGKSWRFAARASGTFEYLCTFHPNMKGTLVVQ